jgi:hypothetical protein
MAEEDSDGEAAWKGATTDKRHQEGTENEALARLLEYAHRHVSWAGLVLPQVEDAVKGC